MATSPLLDLPHSLVIELPYLRPRLFEIADQPWCPAPIRQQVHQILTFLWLHRIRPFQAQAPYAIVADVLERVLGEIEEEEAQEERQEANGEKEQGRAGANGRSGQRGDIKVVDFCSGAGGPMPAVEKRLNSNRVAKRAAPINVQLSDLHPHPSWSTLTRASPHLSSIPYPVDATSSPKGLHTSRHIRTFCLAFHHFGEGSARRVIEDAMRQSEGICIFEMQEPTLESVLTILALFPLSLLITPFTRPSLRVLLLTYIIPLIPIVLVFDGLVSAWRTRSTEHIQHIASRAALGVNVEVHDSPRGSFSQDRPAGAGPGRVVGQSAGSGPGGEKSERERDEAQAEGTARGTGRREASVRPPLHGLPRVQQLQEVEWKWEFGRKRHTWPFADLTWAVGRRDRSMEGEGQGADE